MSSNEDLAQPKIIKKKKSFHFSGINFRSMISESHGNNMFSYEKLPNIFSSIFTNPEIEVHVKGSDLLKVTKLIRGSSKRFQSLNFQFDTLLTCSAYLKVFFGKVLTCLSFGSVRTPSVRGEMSNEIRKFGKSKKALEQIAYL